MIGNYLFSLFCGLLSFCLQSWLQQYHTSLGERLVYTLQVPTSSPLGQYGFLQPVSFCGYHRNEGVQDTLPQNMTACHIAYLKMKEFEKWQVWEELSDLPLKQVTEPLCEGRPLYTGGKEQPHVQDRHAWRGIGTNRPRCPPGLQQSARTLFHPVPFSTTLRSSSHLAEKLPSLASSLHFLVRSQVT